MKTTVINLSKENAANNAKEKVNKLPLSTSFTDNDPGLKTNESPFTIEVKETPEIEINEFTAGNQQGRNLENTLKLVEELHRRKIQRDRLLLTIQTLEAFEITQKEDAEETDSNFYQGCTLKITDDARREFCTKNPVIIEAVAQFINSLCVLKLAEIEAEIILPA